MDSLQLPPRLQRWVELDPDDEMIEQMTALHRRDPEAAVALFDHRIGFGTAGLRGAMGPGPSAMNSLVIRQTTAGLMRWFIEGKATSAPRVLIGFDARHRSASFAADVADEVAAAGGVALLFDAPVPTPVAAHELLVRGVDAAVVITASHNPPADNGYKLYLGDGIQIVPPADQEIASAIDAVVSEQMGAVTGHRSQTVVSQVGLDANDGELLSVSATEAATRHRSSAVASLRTSARDVQILYTAMHGVSGRVVLDALAAAGFPTPTIVVEQFEPDPDFPTTPYPNPEESGALDLAFQTAERLGSEAHDGVRRPDIIVANDPDGDRLAVAVPTGSGWRRLTGDEVGALLADHLLRHLGRDGTERVAIVASSIVSSRFIERLAAYHGAHSVRTLTGFKWVARPIVDRPDEDYVVGYEEALGYCVNPAVRDKDGVSAALVIAEVAAECRQRSESLLDRLDRLAQRHGLFATSQVSIGFGDRSLHHQSELRSRAADLNPSSVAGVEVVETEFLDQGRTLPPTAGVMLDLADGSRIIVRPSGTEPKIKAYLEVVEDARPGTPVAQLRENAQRRLARLDEAVRRLLEG